MKDYYNAKDVMNITGSSLALAHEIIELIECTTLVKIREILDSKDFEERVVELIKKEVYSTSSE